MEGTWGFEGQSYKDLQRSGTSYLRKRGYTAGGRPKGDVKSEQCAFERKCISTPCGGKPR